MKPKGLLKDSAIPVAKGLTISDIRELPDAIKKIGFPLVFKPLDGNHGKGATINVKTEEAANEAFEYAKTYSRKIIVERFITGYDFRILVIDHSMVAAALRVPAHVKGNGQLTIKELIDKENEDPRRGYGHENVLTEITVDRDTPGFAGEKQLHPRYRTCRMVRFSI